MRFKNLIIPLIAFFLLAGCVDDDFGHPNFEKIPVTVNGPHAQILKGTADIVPLGGLIRSFQVTDGNLTCASSDDQGTSSATIPLSCNDGRHGVAIFRRAQNDGYIQFGDGTYVKFELGAAADVY